MEYIILLSRKEVNLLKLCYRSLMPTFKTKIDDKAYKVLEEVFRGQPIETVESNEIAREGGVLNCITWNILTE
ncbi:hypothetical protein ES708_11350 [subsurface metagenome]